MRFHFDPVKITLLLTAVGFLFAVLCWALGKVFRRRPNGMAPTGLLAVWGGIVVLLAGMGRLFMFLVELIPDEQPAPSKPRYAYRDQVVAHPDETHLADGTPILD